MEIFCQLFYNNFFISVCVGIDQFSWSHVCNQLITFLLNLILITLQTFFCDFENRSIVLSFSFYPKFSCVAFRDPLYFFCISNPTLCWSLPLFLASFDWILSVWWFIRWLDTFAGWSGFFWLSQFISLNSHLISHFKPESIVQTNLTNCEIISYPSFSSPPLSLSLSLFLKTIVHIGFRNHRVFNCKIGFDCKSYFPSHWCLVDISWIDIISFDCHRQRHSHLAFFLLKSFFLVFIFLAAMTPLYKARGQFFGLRMFNWFSVSPIDRKCRFPPTTSTSTNTHT